MAPDGHAAVAGAVDGVLTWGDLAGPEPDVSVLQSGGSDDQTAVAVTFITASDTRFTLSRVGQVARCRGTSRGGPVVTISGPGWLFMAPEIGWVEFGRGCSRQAIGY